MERHQRFENGDFKENYFTLRSKIRVKTPQQRTWRDPNQEELTKVRDSIYVFSPLIAYFPTFVFDFPETIFLTNRGNNVDRFYRRVFQDILDFDGQGHTIEKDIVRRVRGEGMVVPWPAFFAIWFRHDERDKIQHVMDRAGSAVTRSVFGRWNQIFGEDAGDKEIIIPHELVEGEKQDSAGNKIKTQEHDIQIKFQIKDGTRRFAVSDRSLGFRWFFAFMLFTQLRVARSRSRPLLFLFDEPASNLHATAQQKLIDSFPEIARNHHMLAYSTHSHYMIEPKWLEQTFIVTNRADDPLESVLGAVSLDDESLDIKATNYRKFVNDHPNLSQISYFQPILDRLEVVPSRFDIQQKSIVVEGKSDYYILRYIQKLLRKRELPFVPALGAGTFESLIALHIGWGLKCLFVLDGDKKGKSERERYISEFGLAPDRIATIDEFVPGISEIESLLDDEAAGFIRSELQLQSRPSKKQVMRFFQERLASDNVEPISAAFKDQGELLLSSLHERLTR